MARLNIDLGTAGNPNTGDSLRVAMAKINDNFAEVYGSITGTAGYLTSGTTNGNVVIQPNGTGVIELDQLQITDDSITSLATNASIDITGNGTGGVNIEALSFNGTSISSSDSTAINLNENVIVDGNITVTGSITGNVTVTSIDADSTTVSNLEVDNLKASAVVTEAEGLNSSDNDTSFPTTAAVKDYVDNTATGDLTISGSTISAPSNADLSLNAGGTGSVDIEAIQIKGTEISSADSTQVTIKENLLVTGNIETASDLTVGGDATATTFIGDLRGATVFQAKATEDISKGEAVYISGLSGNTPEVALARANSASTMPAFGIAESDIANTATGNIVTFGSCPGHNVSDFGETSITFALGDTVFISSAEAGKLTNVAPTGESNLIQNIGKIERAAPTSNMTIKVGGAGRTNATPALNNGNIFIGNGSNQSSTVPLATQLTNYVALSVVGDDSTGTSFNIGESIKIAGAGSVTTAMSGDTLTITGSGTSLPDGSVSSNFFGVGDDDDLKIFHNGSHSIIRETGTGSLYIQSDNNVIIGKDSSSETMIKGIADGAVELYHDNTKKFETTADGISVTDHIAIADNGEVRFGTDNDMRIYHSGTTGNIDNNTGTLILDGSTVRIQDGAMANTAISAANGIATLLFENSAKLVTSTDGVAVTGKITGLTDPTAAQDAATKAYVDANSGGSTGDITFTGSTMISPSNADITLDPAGTGGIVAQGPVTFNAGYIEKINALTSSSTITVDCSLASIHTVTLGTSTEFNISNLPTGGSVTLIITQDGSGNRTATFGTDGSSAVKFPSNSSTLSTGSGDIDVVTIVNDGTNFLGNIAKDYRSS